MTHRPRIAPLTALLFILLVAAIPACSKQTTNPGGGGGGAAKELNSGDISLGGTYVHTFNTAGTFNYHCDRHPGQMPGTVTVTAGTPVVDDNISIPGITPFPAKSIKVGAKITWTNNSSMLHTVTSD